MHHRRGIVRRRFFCGRLRRRPRCRLSCRLRRRLRRWLQMRLRLRYLRAGFDGTPRCRRGCRFCRGCRKSGYISFKNIVKSSSCYEFFQPTRMMLLVIFPSQPECFRYNFSGYIPDVMYYRNFTGYFLAGWRLYSVSGDDKRYPSVSVLYIKTFPEVILRVHFDTAYLPDKFKRNIKNPVLLMKRVYTG
jgi:hypothetical protein